MNWWRTFEFLLTAADPLYLFCTCTTAFCRFSPIEPFESLKSFEKSTIVADRLPPPPKPEALARQSFAWLTSLVLYLVCT